MRTKQQVHIHILFCQVKERSLTSDEEISVEPLDKRGKLFLYLLVPEMSSYRTSTMKFARRFHFSLADLYLCKSSAPGPCRDASSLASLSASELPSHLAKSPGAAPASARALWAPEP